MKGDGDYLKESKSYQIEESENDIKRDKFSLFYHEMSKPQLINIIKQKTEEIDKLTEKVNLSGSHDDKMKIFQAKLEEEIEENDKATNILRSTIDKIFEIIKSMMNSLGLSFDKSEFLRESGYTSSNFLQMVENYDDQDDEIRSEQQEQMNLLNDINEQMNVALKKLEEVASQTMRSNVRLEKDFSQARKNLEKVSDDKFMDKIILEKQRLHRLLQSNEKERSELINGIANVLEEGMSEKLNDMSRQELISYVHKVCYRLQEVEKDKKQILVKHLKAQEEERKKYYDLLNMVKGMKVVGTGFTQVFQ